MRREGTCHFCGQIKSVVVGEGLTQEEVDRIVESECDCDGARTEQRLADDAAQIENDIKELLSEHKAADILKECIPLIQHSVISSIGIQINETTKVNLGTTSKGALKFAKVVTVKQERKAQ